MWQRLEEGCRKPVLGVSETQVKRAWNESQTVDKALTHNNNNNNNNNNNSNNSNSKRKRCTTA